MREENLHFAIKDRIEIEGKCYIVKGKINFLNEADGCNWTEYKLVDVTNSSNIRWLSIDMVYHEYAIYKAWQIQKKVDVEKRGYHLADEGIAKVMDLAGNVDVEYTNQVKYEEYEDATEEKIISIEEWNDEIEYSVGYYLDANDIEREDRFRERTKKVNTMTSTYRTTQARNNSRSGFKRGSVIFLPLFIIGIMLIGKIFSVINEVNLNKVISKDSQFTYVTSITADIDNDQKADVYETSMSVEETAKAILRMAGSSVKNVDENLEDGTVAIVTRTHYCLVYEDENGQTLIQVSTRKYAYTSRQEPYRSRRSTYNYYRSYYYTTSYAEDNKQYNGNNAYEDYSGGTVATDSNNRYKTYSDTIKQDSVASRSSSGGGTSSGK